MSTKKNDETVATPTDKRVEVYVERGPGNDDPNLLIGVNGVNYLLPKGQTSLVPDYVAEEFKRSQKAKAARYTRMDSLIAESGK